VSIFVEFFLYWSNLSTGIQHTWWRWYSTHVLEWGGYEQSVCGINW